jgi:hypothetical protein
MELIYIFNFFNNTINDQPIEPMKQPVKTIF